jgi:glucose uptake protein GlcU
MFCASSAPWSRRQLARCALVWLCVLTVATAAAAKTKSASAGPLQQQQQQQQGDGGAGIVDSHAINTAASKEYYGWMAALVSMVSFGSFGVPIRSTRSLQVHPLVMQSFKTIVCFLTCGWVLVAFPAAEPVPLSSTIKWGLLSGVFWVPGATCGVYAIRTAGLAIAVGTWSSINVVSSFVFGILLFREQVHSLAATAMYFVCLMTGLIGMAKYAAASTSSPSSSLPSSTTTPSATTGASLTVSEANDDIGISTSYSSAGSARLHSRSHLSTSSTTGNTSVTAPMINGSNSNNNNSIGSNSNGSSLGQRVEMTRMKRYFPSAMSIFKRSTSTSIEQSNAAESIQHDINSRGKKDYETAAYSTESTSYDASDINPHLSHQDINDTHTNGDTDSESDYESDLEQSDESIDGGEDDAEHRGESDQSRTLLTKKRRQRKHRSRYSACGRLRYCWLYRIWMSLTTRQVGVLCAVINGAWGGLNLIPMHFARKENPHMSPGGYLIPYACGSFIVNTVMWLVMYFYYLYQSQGEMHTALKIMPSWHLRKLWWPGLQAGLLYSMGNAASIMAVSYLGQATGYAACQMQLLVSGLWGVVWFQEIQGRETVSKWFMSACLAVGGIIGLSYQHVGGSSH